MFFCGQVFNLTQDFFSFLVCLGLSTCSAHQLMHQTNPRNWKRDQLISKITSSKACFSTPQPVRYLLFLKITKFYNEKLERFIIKKSLIFFDLLLGLFEDDKIIYSFLLACSLGKESKGLMDSEEWKFLLDFTQNQEEAAKSGANAIVSDRDDIIGNISI